METTTEYITQRVRTDKATLLKLNYRRLKNYFILDISPRGENLAGEFMKILKEETGIDLLELKKNEDIKKQLRQFNKSLNKAAKRARIYLPNQN